MTFRVMLGAGGVNCQPGWSEREDWVGTLCFPPSASSAES